MMRTTAEHGRPLPPELCERARRLAQVHCECVVTELTGLGPASLHRLKKRGWKAFPKGFNQRPRPTDFAIQCRHMTVLELAAHYRTSNSIIARWKREIGLSGRVSA